MDNKKIILNLGCGYKPMTNATNVDINSHDGVDIVADLSNKFPFPDCFADEIHANHIIEHLPDVIRFINECHRVLKQGGKLFIRVPHSSNVSANGMIEHYKAFSFHTLKHTFTGSHYMGGKKFEQVYCRLNWWYSQEGVDRFSFVPKALVPFVLLFDKIFTYLARLSPEVCENLWCYWVGGFREIEYLGVKK